MVVETTGLEVVQREAEATLVVETTGLEVAELWGQIVACRNRTIEPISKERQQHKRHRHMPF